MALLRGRLPDAWTASELKTITSRTRLQVAGQVICRQRPGTAKGVCFVSLEDETGVANVVVSPAMFEANRLLLTTEPFLLVEGVAERRHGTVHVRAEKLARVDFWVGDGSVA
jgi:error-prone DNA polymerase